ncbi:hypothetical protein ACFQ68_13185 [Amycolatopsis japonica]|uniref:hypothetical protein n=1 Tax=Amycolatopsis japonica TaxID=208439 RepID=UPI00366ACE9C
MTTRRRIEDVVSGEQIVQANGCWDRVHGVDHEREKDAVFVTTDRARDVRYAVGTLVSIV